MKKTENFEVIIIGAGLSGLTLAKEICDRTNYKILMPRMLSGKLVGQLLRFISSIKQPQYILEAEF